MHQILIFHTLKGIILEIRKVPLKVCSNEPSSLSMHVPKTSSGKFGLFTLVTGCVCRKTALFGAWSMCSVMQVGDLRLLNALLGKVYIYIHVGFCSMEVSLD